MLIMKLLVIFDLVVLLNVGDEGLVDVLGIGEDMCCVCCGIGWVEGQLCIVCGGIGKILQGIGGGQVKMLLCVCVLIVQVCMMSDVSCVVCVMFVFVQIDLICVWIVLIDMLCSVVYFCGECLLQYSSMVRLVLVDDSLQNICKCCVCVVGECRLVVVISVVMLGCLCVRCDCLGMGISVSGSGLLVVCCSNSLLCVNVCCYCVLLMQFFGVNWLFMICSVGLVVISCWVV